jgi:mRNA-degrading endonuclease RelE of RelBE toxin-antitoxin system
MPFDITITEAALGHLASLTTRERRELEAAIRARLVHQPTQLSKAIKLLRPNPVGRYELRVGDLRAIYNVDENTVSITVIGRKDGNRLIVEGEEFHDHRDNPTEPSGDGPSQDAE